MQALRIYTAFIKLNHNYFTYPVLSTASTCFVNMNLIALRMFVPLYVTLLAIFCFYIKPLHVGGHTPYQPFHSHRYLCLVSSVIRHKRWTIF